MGATMLDKVMVLPKISLILGLTATATIKGLMVGINGAPSFSEHAINAAVRAGLATLSVEQIQWLLPSFVNSYRSWCKGRKSTPDVCKFKGPTGDVDGFWLGDKSTAKYHMVYYHGGGWVTPGHSGHLDMLAKIISWSDNKLAIFCVAYTLSPEAPYPIAIGQCVEGLRYLLDQEGVSPSNVLLGGDSAGGNLVLAVISHILHPHPRKELVEPLQINQPLFGAILVSPWISSDTTRYESFRKYAERDSFPVAAVEYWTNCYKGNYRSIPSDEYMWPAHADASWWQGSPCKDMLATVGEHEITFDSTADWAQKYRQGAGNAALDLAVGAQETHIYPIVSPMTDKKIRDHKNRTQEGAIMNWVKSKIA